MRKQLIATVAAIVTAFSLTSCAAGPHQLRRTVDDWDQKMYVNSPWLSGVLWFIPVFPILTYGAGFVDFFTTDAYAFWFHDAWDGKGTGFERHKVEATDGTMGSLLNDDAGWFKVKK